VFNVDEPARGHPDRSPIAEGDQEMAGHSQDRQTYRTWWFSGISFVAGALVTFLLTLVGKTQEIDYVSLLDKQAKTFELFGESVAQIYIPPTTDEAHSKFLQSKVLLAIYGSASQLRSAYNYFYQRHLLAEKCDADDRSATKTLSCEDSRIFKAYRCTDAQAIKEDVEIYQAFRRELLRVSWIDIVLGRDPRFMAEEREEEQKIIALLVHNCIIF
jgi:hypothetical protein